MDNPGDLTAPFKLEIKDLGDRRREITYETDPREGTKTPITTIWTRKRYFTRRNTVYGNVYLDESASGRQRVVKEIVRQESAGGNRYFELETMARVVGAMKPDHGRLFVNLLGWFDSPDRLSLVLEYCPLGDIDHCFTDPVPEQVVRTVAGQLLEGIAVLHELGIAHRDIKPQNILVAQTDPIWVKIADFGISKYTDGKTDLRSIVGTEGYVAPELLFDDTKNVSKYSNAVDMWSLGCLLFYLLTKEAAFPSYEGLRDFYRGDVPFPASLLVKKGVGPSTVSFLKRLMEPVPDDRPEASINLLTQWDITDSQKTQTSLIEQTALVTAESSASQSEEVVPVSPLISPQWPSARSISQLPMDYWSSELLSTVGTSQEADIRRTRALLESGADPNRMRNGFTSLHHAAKQGSADTVQLLLEYGADTWIKTAEYDETALHLATLRGDSEAFVKILRQLLDRGVNVNAQDSTGNTALHLAIMRLSDISAIDALLALGARTDLLGKDGLTPLQYALSLDREDKATALLSNGADPNTPSPHGCRPLHKAIVSRRISLKLVNQLLDKGADVNEKDDDGVSPLHEAVRQNRPDLVHYLIDRGASCALGSTQLEKRLRWMQFRRGLPWPLRASSDSLVATRVASTNIMHVNSRRRRPNRSTAVIDSSTKHGVRMLASNVRGSSSYNVCTRSGCMALIVETVPRSIII